MPSRSSDPFAGALADACRLIVDAVGRAGRPDPVVVIDGRSGAGKSTLSRLVEAAWPLASPATRVELDWIYPGWDGLAAGSDRARIGILEPLRRGENGCWHGWDWERNVDRRDDRHQVDRGRAVILEGCGALTRETAALSDVRVWVDAPGEARKERALTRDGAGFRPYWDRWAAQEDAHIARNDPRSLATLVVRVP